MKKPVFLHCEHCGNLIGVVDDYGVPVICCGEPMKVLEPNTVDAAQEKHVPVPEVKGSIVTVKIGSVPHPMLEEHHIEWVYLLTEQGGQRKQLQVGGAPETSFALVDGDKAVEVYAYCNLHGLWMAKI